MKDSIKKRISLILSLVFVYLFVTVAMPFLSVIAGPTFHNHHLTIIEEDIPAGEWYYIFVPQIRDIDPRIQNVMKYSPEMHYKAK